MTLIETSPIWLVENHKDIPMTSKQYRTFCEGYCAGWECRYEPISLGDGWHYIYRSGWLLKKFRYQLKEDGLFHLVEHFTTEKEKGRDLLSEILVEGLFETSLVELVHL